MMLKTFRYTLLALTLGLLGCPATPPTGDGDGDGDTAGDGDGDTIGDGGPADAGLEEPSDAGSSESDGGAGDGDGDGDTTVDPIPEPDYQVSARAKLQWKRVRAVEQDLMSALSLAQNEVCNELDRFSCARNVHTVALGGNEPFYKAMYKPLAEPSVTTSIAIDRMVLAACSFAAERDQAGTAQVFTALDLDAATIADGADVDLTITNLFKRLHARLPTDAEVSEVKALLVDDDGNAVSALDFAKTSCFAIGTMSEFIFY